MSVSTTINVCPAFPVVQSVAKPNDENQFLGFYDASSLILSDVLYMLSGHFSLVKNDSRLYELFCSLQDRLADISGVPDVTYFGKEKIAYFGIP